MLWLPNASTLSAHFTERFQEIKFNIVHNLCTYFTQVSHPITWLEICLVVPLWFITILSIHSQVWWADLARGEPGSRSVIWINPMCGAWVRSAKKHLIGTLPPHRPSITTGAVIEKDYLCHSHRLSRSNSSSTSPTTRWRSPPFPPHVAVCSELCFLAKNFHRHAGSRLPSLNQLSTFRVPLILLTPKHLKATNGEVFPPRSVRTPSFLNRQTMPWPTSPTAPNFSSADSVSAVFPKISSAHSYPLAWKTWRVRLYLRVFVFLIWFSLCFICFAFIKQMTCMDRNFASAIFSL